MAVVTWDGSSSTAYSTAATCDTGSVPADGDDVVIPDTSSINACNVDSNDSCNSLTVSTNGEIGSDSGSKLTILGEADGTGATTDGYAVKIDGVITDNTTTSLDLDMRTPATTLIDIVPTSGSLRNLEIKDPTKTYTGRISDTVKSILKDLRIKKFDIDPTRNSYNFISRSRGGLDLITDLCRRSIPVNGDPGYFFYETQDGFNFKAIDNLIAEDPVETYTYTAGLQANLDNDENDFKIVREPNFIKDQKVQERKKWTSSRNIFFNPLTLKTDETVYTMKTSSPKKTLGKKVTYTDDIKGYTTTHKHVLDIGSLGDFNEITPNNDPREWQAKSPMRYNLLHSQIIEIQVPCNLKLRAGNIIRVEFERQGDDKSLGGIDEQTSGNFLILHLCHHFDTKRSFTSMTIIRDTYGLHTGK